MSTSITPSELQKQTVAASDDMRPRLENVSDIALHEFVSTSDIDFETSSETDSEIKTTQDIRDNADEGVWSLASEPNEDICTVDEARELMLELRKVGPDKFIHNNLETRKMNVRKLCTAFGFDLPNLEGVRTDENYLLALGPLIQREMERRVALPEYKTIGDAARLLRDKSNIIVITGAGISTSLGIPDFRSKSTGFYAMLREQGFEDPESLFNLETFELDPTDFFTLAGETLPKHAGSTTPTHAFIALLQNNNKLLTNYTQNIDNVESNAKIKPTRLIQCHGSWGGATCRQCGHKVKGEEIFEDVRMKRVARCVKCVQHLSAPGASMKRKRSANGYRRSKKKGSYEDSDDDEQYNIPEAGVMKPDITFFGEPLPEAFFQRIMKDRPEIDPSTGKATQLSDDERKQRRPDLLEPPYGPADLVLVIGTTMKVAPVSDIPHYIPHDIPHIYISRDPIKHINFDINLIGDCDPICAELCRLAGLELQHSMLAKDLKVDVQPYDDEHDNMYTVKIV